MSNTIIITEGKFDLMILSKILGYLNSKQSYKIESADGYSSALSKARSYLSLNKKILLITDSDSIIETEVIERRQFINSYINIRNENLFKSILIVPELEVIFIENEVFVKKYLSLYKNNNLLETIKISPKKIIEKQLKIRREKLLELMSTDILDAFKDNNYIKEMQEFINGI